MTAGELLLQWLTHTREGSWATFRRGVSGVYAEDDGSASRPGGISTQLSELAHVRFFVDGGNRWRVFAPLLGGLSRPSQAVLSGGRIPRLVDALARACESQGCTMQIVQSSDAPDSIRVSGTPEALRRAAREAEIPYVPELASALCTELEPLAAALKSALPAAAPMNWSVRSFDLKAMRWVDEVLPDTAYEYRSRHGGLRHYVRGPGHALLELDRRRSVYGAAYMNRMALLSYDEERRTLSVPKGAPLPEPLARAAAACSGRPAVAHGDRLLYEDVAPVVAGVLMASSGQRPPEPQWLANGSSTR